MRFWKRLRLTLEMIKFEHSVFALPFALTGALLAFRESHLRPRVFGDKLLWIVIAMVGARSAAMAFNRILDADIDARNPRTRMRHIPAGILSAGFAWGFVDRFGAGVSARGARAESALPETGASGAGLGLLLFVHQALHLVFAFDSRVYRWASRRRRRGSPSRDRWIRGSYGSPRR